MTINRITCFATTIFAAIVAVAVPARGVPLSDLISSGETIQVGVLLFSGFSYSQTGDMPASSDVSVYTYTSPNGDEGLAFLGAFSDSGGGSGSDGLIRYNVASLQTGISISGSILSIDPTYLGGDSSYLGGNGVVSVTENWPQIDPNSIYIKPLSTDVPASSPFNFGSTFSYNSFPSLDVQDNVFASSSGGGVVLAAYEAAFHVVQTPIPEPSTFVLAGFAGLALLAYRRRIAAI